MLFTARAVAGASSAAERRRRFMSVVQQSACRTVCSRSSWNGRCNAPARRESEDHMVQATESQTAERRAFVKNIHGVRYQVKDVARSVAFYTRHLGFTLEHQQLPAFANVSLGDAQVMLSG